MMGASHPWHLTLIMVNASGGLHARTTFAGAR